MEQESGRHPMQIQKSVLAPPPPPYARHEASNRNYPTKHQQFELKKAF